MIIKIVKLIDSNQYIYENKPYGPVDVRTAESETKEEKQAVIETLKSFNYAIDDKNILRLVTILERETLKKAILDSELLFEETIDLLKRQPMARIRNCDSAGYWVNMDTGETTPFIKPHENNLSFFDHVFQTSLGPYSPMFGEQIIASRRNEEATEAFIRSIHWYNNSNLHTKSYLQFLYKWIAIETIAKKSTDEDIIPKICLVLGFLTSKYSKTIPANEAKKLTSIKGYRHYRNFIKGELYKCKKMRNAIVHSGFKETNLLNDNLKLKLYIIDSAYSCMINTIEKIVCTGITTIKEVWDVMCEYVIKDEKTMKWISETFLHQVGIIVSKNDDLHYNDSSFGVDDEL